MILAIAERYGQSPQSVEDWEERWFNRAVTLIEAEGLKYQAEKATRRL